MFSSPSPQATCVIANSACIEAAARAVAAAALAADSQRDTSNQVLAEMLESTALVAELDHEFFGRLAIRSKYRDRGKALPHPALPRNRMITRPQPDNVPEAWLASDLEGLSNLMRSGSPPRCAFSLMGLTPARAMAKVDMGLYAEILALPPGPPSKMLPSTPAQAIVDHLCMTHEVEPGNIEGMTLRRGCNETRAREFEAAGIVVHRIPNGTWEAMAQAVLPVDSGPVRIAFGSSGPLEALHAAFVAKASGGHLVIQPLSETGVPVGRVLDADRLIKSKDVLLAAAGIVSPADGSGLLAGVRHSPATGRAYVSVLVSSPAIGAIPLRYVAAFTHGRFESLAPIDPSQPLDAFLLEGWLAANGRLTAYEQACGEGRSVEYFNHAPCIPGFEDRDERGLIAALNSAAEGGWIETDSETCTMDSSLERLTWSVR